MITNDVISYPAYYKVKNEEQEELLIEALSQDLEGEGLFLDEVFYVKENESKEWKEVIME